LYGDRGLLRYAEIQREPVLIEGVAAINGVEMALVRTGSRLQRFLQNSDQWRELHRDPTASLHARVKPLATALRD
jgi:hypothetical protein